MRPKIYTTGDGRDKQYARHENGTLFARDYRPDIPGWGKWHVSINQHPFGLYPAPRYGHARLPELESV